MKRKGLIKCPHCGKWKPLTDYYITRQGYRSGWCKECWCAREREYRKKYGYRHKKERITRGKDGRMHHYIPGGVKGNKGGHWGIYWSQSMTEYFTGNYATTTNEDLATWLRVSKSSLARKARELGLKKNPVWLRNIQAKYAVKAARISRYFGKRRKYNHNQAERKEDDIGQIQD